MNQKLIIVLAVTVFVCGCQTAAVNTVTKTYPPTSVTITEPEGKVFLMTHPALRELEEAEKAELVSRYIWDEKSTDEVRLVPSERYRCVGGWKTNTSPGRTLAYCRATLLP